MFSGISTTLALTLLALAAGVLALLHLLRIRPRPVVVVTTLFWRQAQRPSRARTLWGRLRHPLTYLLLLALAAALIFSLTRPDWPGAAPPRATVIIIDAGAPMASSVGAMPTPLAQALLAARDIADGLTGRDRLAVMVADPRPRVVLGFDAPRAILPARLAGLAAAEAPASLAAAYRLAGNLVRGEPNARVVVLTDRHHDDLPGLPAEINVITVGRRAGNAAILAVSQTRSEAGPGRVSVAVRVGYWGEAARTVAVECRTPDDAYVRTVSLTLAPGATGELHFDDIPAKAAQLLLTLTPPDAVAADNQLILPQSVFQPITVALGTAAPPALGEIIAQSAWLSLVADPGQAEVVVMGAPVIEPASAAAFVVFAGEGAPLAADQPVEPAPAQPLTADLDFAGAEVGGLGLPASLDVASPLLVTGAATLAAWSEAEEGGAPAAWFSAGLFDAAGAMVRQPAFIVLCERIFFALAGRSPLPLILPSEQAEYFPVGPDVIYTPGSRTAGDLTSAAAAPGDRPASSRRPTLVSALLLAALALLLLQIALHTRGRIP